MFKKALLYSEPLDILKYTTALKEMSFFESSFLCGLIKRYKPHKILEIGVAAGATTAVILNTISKLGLDSKLISIDLCTVYYLDARKNTGFAVEEVKPFINHSINYQLLTGNVSSAFLEEIGDGVDFLILDTMHVLPGEILDFIACLPYLTKDAIVVLHDISWNHLGDAASEYTRNAFSTKLLFDTVTADKILCKDDTRLSEYPNIAAFHCTPETRKNIDDVFSVLTATWHYIPEKEHITSYENCFLKHYQQDQVEMFLKAVSLNENTYKNINQSQKTNGALRLIGMFHRLWTQYEYIVFYGAGEIGNQFFNYINEFGLTIAAYAISNYSTMACSTLKNVPVYYLKDIPFPKEKTIVVLTLDKKHHYEVIENLKKADFFNIFMHNDKESFEKLCNIIHCLSK